MHVNHIYHGNCLPIMRTFEDNSIDAIVTDPPYGISFMNKKWDYDVPSTEIWREALRIMKPGAHMLVACGTRTQHRMVVNIEDAGYEIRDCIVYCYGSGFPKSLNISKALDKELGEVREVVGQSDRGSGAQPSKLNNHDKGDTGIGYADGSGKVFNITAPSSPLAKQYDGYGTGLKPALEIWTLARKPISERNIAFNVMRWGTGGINVDACRISYETGGNAASNPLLRKEKGISSTHNPDIGSSNYQIRKETKESLPHNSGRFPANLIHDGSQEVLDLFPYTKTGNLNHTYKERQGNVYGKDIPRTHVSIGSEGSASRFFYCAKASKSEKGPNCIHPTVKPLKLMQYLCRLITPRNGIILDPFAGSGSTLIAARNEGFNYIGIEMNEEYVTIAKHRLGDETTSTAA